TLDPSAADWSGGEAIQITLKPLFAGDNLDYHWFEFEGVSGSASCGQCHREYEEWKSDQHSRAAVNSHFLNMYTGEDANGNRGEITEFGSDGLPKPRDPNAPDYGPGFMLDNPGRAGNCAACHTPLASNSPNTQNCAWSGCHTSLTIERSNGIIAPHAMPLSLKGDAGEGITCDFCHKIGDVYLDPKTGLPYPDMPGIMSLRLYRPPEGEQVFFGTLVDVDRRDTYLPLLSKSEYCAGCHFGVFGGVVGMGEVTGGTVIYNSYGEWLDSPYSDPETGKTCQDCHMPVSDAKWFVYPEKGGIVRDYAELHTHAMPGAADENLLQNTVTMNTTAERSSNQLKVEVHITNDQAGHHVPTDFPTRSMILVIEALDADGQTLALSAGPVNPAYSGDYGGLPGKTFAKVLRDEWTGETPTGAIWRPVTIVEDTRLPALETDTTNYTFDAPAGKVVTVNVRLLFRRSFSELMKQKGWTTPDILMEHETLTVPAN
ncbi:MAG: cytochrome c family protein, partial [Anaerolineae bacterium]|nr:cytochrome c family protein [Anaerolineae bacterium]